MRILDILLIIISSAGFLHGLLFAVYLFFFKNKRTNSNILLGCILVFMAFRIGKSVMLNFGENLEPIFIFIGLGFLLLIGPFLRWYFLTMTHPDFKVSKRHFLELLPFFMLFVASFFISTTWFDENNRQAVIIFGSVLLFIYLHFAFYIFLAGWQLKKHKQTYKNSLQTKSQKVIKEWLQVLLIGFIVIWISYFLNIVENTVPYIVGPIMYSLVVYYLSYKALQLKITDINGEVYKINDNELLFNEISSLVQKDKLYLESDISLSSLSKLIGKTKQKTSEVINQYANQNFNDFINYYRVQEAKKLLLEEKSKNFTISAIAFDVGFSSLSSFNGAFKKFEKITPSVFRKGTLD